MNDVIWNKFLQDENQLELQQNQLLQAKLTNIALVKHLKHYYDEASANITYALNNYINTHFQYHVDHSLFDNNDGKRKAIKTICF